LGRKECPAGERLLVGKKKRTMRESTGKDKHTGPATLPMFASNKTTFSLMVNMIPNHTAYPISSGHFRVTELIFSSLSIPLKKDPTPKFKS
jgi:hypothetical protein